MDQTIVLRASVPTREDHPRPGRIPPLPGLDELLRRPDDRLIVDIGLDRSDIEKPEAAFRREWSRQRALWNL